MRTLYENQKYKIIINAWQILQNATIVSLNTNVINDNAAIYHFRIATMCSYDKSGHRHFQEGDINVYCTFIVFMKHITNKLNYFGAIIEW